MKITNLPNHIAIILDGNGRWAKKRLLPRTVGHYYGVLNIPKIANYANSIGIKEMTIFTFSTENWNRPKDEVSYLMTEPINLVEKKFDSIIKSNIKINVVGRKDRIPNKALEVIKKIELASINNTGLILNVAFDYGAKDEILFAIKQMNEFTIDELEENLMVKTPVDLLIRTSGELRLSNFLLWQAAYAELYFTKKHWPAFNKKEFNKALIAYNKRNRRFGKVKE